MKIRCNNCYRVLNQNEEYCTSCGEYSAKMHNAMITGNYGPDNLGKFSTRELRDIVERIDDWLDDEYDTFGL